MASISALAPSLRRRLPGLVLGAAALLALAAPAVEGSAQGAGPTATAAGRRTVAVRVETVETKVMPVVIDVVGNAQAVASIPIRTRVDSQIVSIGVAEGGHVEPGQVLFTLDSRAVEAQIAQARAIVARDEAQSVLVRSDLERTRQLVATRTKSVRDLELAKTLVAAQDATIAADRAALQNLEVLASYYRIVSPIAGRVGSIPLKPGASVRAADAPLLATVNQLDPIHVAFSVPQALVPGLRAAMTAGPVGVVARRADGTAPPLAGRVAFIENTIDTTTGTLGVKAIVDNPHEALLPGEFVQVRVLLATQPQALVVPDRAVQLGQSGTFVWAVAADGTAEVRRVTVDRSVDGLTVVAQGLASGDRVVVDGQLKLAAGAALDILPPADAAAPKTPSPKSGS